ncbi:hypothetical protein M5D96_006732 [Drosophila gunungcola]|uniref:Uncharacterized protein n=1 Tax=Drosophila gunungcola TaxID=103775 RepID=A0A9Q0BR68_9MUSC|nr:hypothetical protein M5D96_006732 [Drosophila gunungcola]
MPSIRIRTRYPTHIRTICSPERQRAVRIPSCPIRITIPHLRIHIPTIRQGIMVMDMPIILPTLMVIRIRSNIIRTTIRIRTRMSSIWRQWVIRDHHKAHSRQLEEAVEEEVEEE